jgi:hypothetical protein
MAHVNLGGSALAVIGPAVASFNYVGIGGIGTSGQAAIVSSAQTWVGYPSDENAGDVVLSGAAIIASSFTPRYYSPLEGGMVLGGADNDVISSAYSFSGSGGVQLSGALDEHWTLNPRLLMNVETSGGVGLGGSGDAYRSNYIGLGGLALGGTSLPFSSNTYSYDPHDAPPQDPPTIFTPNQINVSGQAIWTLPFWEHSSSGGVSLGGEYYPAFNVVGNDISQSDQSASTFVSDATVGTVDWTSPSSAASDDGQEASASLSAGDISKYLKSTNFGFNIPSSDTIVGVKVIVDKRSNSDRIKDESVKLVKDGSIQGDDKYAPPGETTPPPWPTMTTVSHSVSSGADDGVAIHLPPEHDFISVNEILSLGVFDAGNSTTQIFFRFDEVDVPQGAKITSAYVTLRVFGNSNANGKTAKIYANDVDDSIRPLIFSEVANANPTTSNVTWTFDSAQTGSVDSPDISSVIQEIVDRDGWVDEQAMTIYLREVVTGTDWSIDFGSFEKTFSPSLEITYYSPSVVEYGSSDTDTWGLDLTYDDINDSTFGMVISAKNDMPQSYSSSSSAFVDHIKASVYHLKVGATIGGSADVVFDRISHVAEGGFVISGEVVIVSSSSYGYIGVGGMALSGSSQPHFEDLTTEVKSEVVYSSFDVFFEYTPADPHVVAAADVDNFCCSPIDTIINLEHNLNLGSKLGNFVKRNSFSLPDNINLIYNIVDGSWKRNFHFVGLEGIETFDVLFEWACTDELGANDIGYDAWKFSILVNYKNEDNGIDARSRVLLLFPKGNFCSVGQGLDATFKINTKTKITTVVESSSLNSSVIDTVINDDVGLFKSIQWFQKPNLKINIKEAGLSSRIFTYVDYESIIPLDNATTNVKEGGVIVSNTGGALEPI